MRILEILTEKRKTGNIGELAAAKFLKKKGYRIVKRNYADSGNEIDIIAEDRDTLAFVEVKTRTLGHESPNEPRPASSVDTPKQRGIIQAARFYTAYNPVSKKKRFDIIEVYVNSNNAKYSLAEIKHLKNTFNVNTAYNYAERYKK